MIPCAALVRGEPETEGAAKLPEERRGQPIISLNAVTKVYSIGATKLRALDEVSLDIYPGEFACIVGRSGSGKSTLLNMIAGLERPTKGQIRVAGKQIERLSEAKLVKFRLDNVGFVFQQFNLFATHTALDNVAMPLMYKGMPKDMRLRQARKMMELVGLSSHMAHMPTQMSGGQQQRVGIARSLVTKPKILFADEPTGNLDLKTSREILRLIRAVCRERGTTLIMVTHDAEIAQYADRVIRLLDGRVIGDVVQESPREIALVQTLPDGTVVELPEGETQAKNA
jgi:putative ABC transport system ATP-binding protein